jgi:hypothetical protein
VTARAEAGFLSNPTISGTIAVFMSCGIISGEVGIAEKSATGGQIGIVEGAAQEIDTSSMIEAVSTSSGSAVVPIKSAHVSIRVMLGFQPLDGHQLLASQERGRRGSSRGSRSREKP